MWFFRSDKDATHESTTTRRFTTSSDIQGTNMNSTDDHAGANKRHAADPHTTCLGDGCHIQGEFEISGDFHVLGTVEGRVRCDGMVRIGPGGLIHGEILSVTTHVEGRFEGKVECSRLIIHDSGQISGTTSTDEFIIEPGGHFEGESKHRTPDNVTQLSRGHSQQQSTNEE